MSEDALLGEMENEWAVSHMAILRLPRSGVAFHLYATELRVPSAPEGFGFRLLFSDTF